MKLFYGAIMGDIAGSIYEFDNIKTKAFTLFDERCFYTDDSVMTLAIADALADEVVAGRFDTNSDDDWRRVFTEYMQRIGRRYPYCGYGSSFNGWLWEENPRPYNSCGNGSAMRVSAVAYFARSLEECERLARLTADISHDHPDGVAGALATAGAVYMALHGGTKAEIKAYVDKYYGEEVKRYTQEKGLPAFTLDEIRPLYSFDHYAGLCKGTVPFALEAFLESADFEDCIRNTVSIGGDTDTLAAISGAIAEAYYGTPYTFIPAALEELPPDLRPILDKLEDLAWPLDAKDE